MSLDRFLHDQKIVRQPMLLTRHIKARFDAEENVSIFRLEHGCEKSYSMRCWNRFTNRSEWCPNCASAYPMICGLKKFNLQVTVSQRNLAKLCALREKKWPGAK
jgi:hypothetical protein